MVEQEQKSPSICVGLFDTEKVNSSIYAYPIGIAYCYPNSDTVDIAVAEQGLHRQLHRAYMHDTPNTADFRPLDKTDGASAFAWQKISKRSGLVKGIITHVCCFPLDEQLDLAPELRKKISTQRRLAAHALATVLHNELYEWLPVRNIMCEMDIPGDLLNSNQGGIIIH